MTNPKVTVLMSVLNGAEYLKVAIDSILAQTFEDFEFVIINNGSSDGTQQIIAAYNDPRIIYLNNERPLTLTQALNQGLNIARGDYVARLDADDIATPDRLTKQVQFLDQHSDVVLLGSNLQNFELDASKLIRPLPSPRMPCEHDEIFECLASSNPVGHVTMMFRLKEVLEMGGYPDHLIYAQDLGLLQRLAPHYRFAALAERLTYVRQHSCQISSLDSWAHIRLEEAISLFRDGIRLPEMTAKGKALGRHSIARSYFSLCRVYIREKKFLAALNALIKGFISSPLLLPQYMFRAGHT